MKTLLIAVSVISTLSMLAPSLGFAEPTHPNEVGLYLTDDGPGGTGTEIFNLPVTLYLVITRPYDVENDLPVSAIQGFDLIIDYDPDPYGNFFLTGMELPELGDLLPMGYIGALGLFVDFYDGHYPLVVDDAVVLMTLTFVNQNPSAVGLSLIPPYYTPAMTYRSETGQSIAMHPISGSHEAPVFVFNGEAVPVKVDSFGSVKTLYR